MGSDLKVVPFTIKTTLSDIPGKLRQLADEFDAAPETMPLTLMWVQYADDGSILVGAFGDNPSKAELVGILTLAARKFTADAGETKRS